MATKIFTAGPESILGHHFTYVLIERERWVDEAQPPPADKQVIGYVGINQVYPSPEIGYSIHPDYWGKGYATEALEGLLKTWWKLPRLPQLNFPEDGSEPIEKVFALCEKINPGSSKVLSKCGFRVIGHIVYDEDELVLWELERPVLTHTCP
jgi:RimJ/RimL family protein N-acetyltransferase